MGAAVYQTPVHYLKSMKFLSVLLLAFLIVSCSSPKNETEDLLPEIYNQGAKIDFLVAGSGDTTLLFVHGWCINKSYWEEQVDFFKSRYRVVAIDLPGHGKSGMERRVWSVEEFGNDVVMIMDALDLENVVLIGHSMGGSIILEAANKRQEKVIGFVGVDNFKDVGVEYTIDQQAEMKNFVEMIKQDYKGTISSFAKGMLFAESTDDKVEQRVMDDILNAPAEISAGIIESLMDVNEKERSLMRNLPLKVHLINSDGIPTNELQLEKYCTHSFEVHSIGPTGHYPMIEAPDQFNKILDEILKNL